MGIRENVCIIVNSILFYIGELNLFSFKMTRSEAPQKVMLSKLFIMIQVNSQSDDAGFSELTWKKSDGAFLKVKITESKPFGVALRLISRPWKR